MRISITPVTVDTETGSVLCSSAEVSVAVSNSVAIRIVPVDSSGNEHPSSATGIVGTVDQPDIAEYMAGIQSITEALAAGRGA